MKLMRGAGLVSALLCICLMAGCMGKANTPQIYIDKNESDVLLSLFAQGTNITGAIDKCCAEVINPSSSENIILYSDSASYYAEDGLSYRELLLKRMESSQADDLYIITAEDVLEFDQRGYLYDLSHLSCLENLSEDALCQSTYNGKVFSVPLSYTGFGFIWNVDLLRRYQLEVPQNLAEFWTVCETLKQNGILPYGANSDFGLSVPAMCAGLAPLYQDASGAEQLAGLASGETPVSTYMRDGFSFLQTMLDKGYLDAAQALSTLPDSEEESALFAGGGCAFISAICRAAAFQKNYAFDVEMTALPILPGGAICVVGADQRLAVNPKSAHLDEALRVVENMCTLQTLDGLADTLGKISSGKGNKAATVPQAAPLAACMAAGGQIPNQDFSLPFNTWNTIKALCVKLCQGTDADELCGMYDQIQQEEIARYGAK